MKQFAVYTLILLLNASPGLAAGLEPGQVVLETVIQKEVEVVRDDGTRETTMVEVANAIPGDELFFTVSYTNTGEEPATGVTIVNPVPENTVYLEGTAAGDGTVVTFSVDGGNTYGEPGQLEVAGEDGKKRRALPEDYTHIRWARGKNLGARETGTVRFSARLK